MLEGLRLLNARNAYIRSYRDRKTKNDYESQNFLVYECSLERTFKTPMLCDLSKVHTGFGIMPIVTHTTDDKEWGKLGLLYPICWIF